MESCGTRLGSPLGSFCEKIELGPGLDWQYAKKGDTYQFLR